MAVGRSRRRAPPTSGGRRLSQAAADGRLGRQLQQAPFDVGAWKRVSYGIRAMYLDADIALRIANATIARRGGQAAAG